jgi:hypothetical protein
MVFIAKELFHSAETRLLPELKIENLLNDIFSLTTYFLDLYEIP